MSKDFFRKCEQSEEWHVWWNQPDNPHTRAFCYFCKRHRERVVAQYNTRGNLDVAVKKPEFILD